MRGYLKLAVGLMVVTMTLSCSKDDDGRSDEEKIESYLEENGLTAQKTSSGLYYIIVEEGTGGHPNLNNRVTVHYQGYFRNGETFDSSYFRGMPSTFALASVIRGWQEGIPLFQKGGKGTLLIPSRLGYGSNPPPGIPPNAVLIFDIELIDFN